MSHSPSRALAPFLTSSVAKSRNAENVCCMKEEKKKRRKKKKGRKLISGEKSLCLLSSKYYLFLKSGAACFLSLGVPLNTLLWQRAQIPSPTSWVTFSFCASFMLFPFIDTLTFHGEWVLFSGQPLSAPTPLSCPHFTSSQLPASRGLCHCQHIARGAVGLPLPYLSFHN